jgi:hypothetical protein
MDNRPSRCLNLYPSIEATTGGTSFKIVNVLCNAPGLCLLAEYTIFSACSYVIVFREIGEPAAAEPEADMVYVCAQN